VLEKDGEINITQSEGRREYSTYNRKKEGKLGWPHLAYEMPSKKGY
jgi:hypothetical protein